MRDMFLVKDIAKTLLPVKIGFVTDSRLPYNTVMASTRLRCYDVINYFDRKFIFAELYKPFKKYRIAVFQKSFSAESIKLAEKLKKQGTKIIFDINVNYVEKQGEAIHYITREQTENVLKMIDLSDEVLVSSDKLKEIYAKYHSDVSLIEESISKNFFKIKKNHRKGEKVNLLYCGYSAKAKELLLIADVLRELHKHFPIRLLFICEKDPQLEIIPYDYIRYNQRHLPRQLVKGDIKLAPRDLSNSYNLGHTFTKVAYPMAVGIPAVASPVPAYLGRHVVICNNEEAWYKELKKLIESSQSRAEIGEKSREFVKSQFSIEKIGSEYVNLFQKYM